LTSAAVDPELLRSLAEDAAVHQPAGDASTRYVTDRYVAEVGPEVDPHMNVVSRLRLGEDDVEAVLAEVRELYRSHERTATTWEVTTGSTPAGLRERLLGLGLEPDEEPHMLALACTEPPLSATPGITVELAETDEQRAEVAGIFREADGWDPTPEWIAMNPRFLARIDGEAVATADITPLPDAVFLGGALTLPRARGRGAYRALVGARWEEAVRRGTPVLVTQSEPMSRPILARLGFRVVGEIHVLVDRFGP
jgi:hypothetical protein